MVCARLTFDCPKLPWLGSSRRSPPISPRSAPAEDKDLRVLGFAGEPREPGRRKPLAAEAGWHYIIARMCHKKVLVVQYPYQKPLDWHQKHVF